MTINKWIPDAKTFAYDLDADFDLQGNPTFDPYYPVHLFWENGHPVVKDINIETGEVINPWVPDAKTFAYDLDADFDLQGNPTFDPYYPVHLFWENGHPVVKDIIVVGS